jgi:hypothetical protein
LEIDVQMAQPWQGSRPRFDTIHIILYSTDLRLVRKYPYWGQNRSSCTTWIYCASSVGT